MNGQLFTQDFLISGIAKTPVWKNLNDASIDALLQSLKSIYQPFSANSRPNEATTEHGRYLTKDLVLAYLNAVAAGDLDSKVSV